MSYHKQTAAFLGVLGQNISSISSEMMQYWIEHPGELQEGLGFLGSKPEVQLVAVAPKVQVVESKIILPDVGLQLDMWKDFWKRYSHVEINVSKIKVPSHQVGYDYLIVMPEEPKLTNNGLFDLCHQYLTCWRWTKDLDAAITYHDRDPRNGSYAIWVRDRQEADEENKNLPASYFWDEEPDGKPRLSKIPTQTYPERMVHSLSYWDRTKKHLDMVNWTTCPGSRYADGYVPLVDRNPRSREVKVRWCKPGDASPNFRPRSAIVSSS